MDFGESESLTPTTKNTGSEMYKPPEYHAKQPTDGIAFDMFSAGVVLFQMFSNNSPF